MTAPLPQDIADRLEKHLIRETKARLTNWGRWWYLGNNLEIRRLSGRRNTSSLYSVMQHGKVASRSGYSSPHTMPVNDQDALALHTRILTLSSDEISELRRFYSDQSGSGTASQGGLRFRAVRKLAGV